MASLQLTIFEEICQFARDELANTVSTKASEHVSNATYNLPFFIRHIRIMLQQGHHKVGQCLRVRITPVHLSDHVQRPCVKLGQGFKTYMGSKVVTSHALNSGASLASLYGMMPGK